MSLKKLCPRCGRVIDAGNKYCEECSKKQSETRKIYDKNIRHGRDKKYNDFYHSNEWETIRAVAVVRDHSLCQDCLKAKKIRVYATVHHIEPIKTNWSRRLDINNLICLCESCHQKRHNELNL